MNGIKIKKSGDYVMPDMSFDYGEKTVMGDSQFGQVISYKKDITDSNSMFLNRKIYISLKDGLWMPYVTDDNISTDDGVPNITWKNGDKNNKTYTQHLFGGVCGQGFGAEIVFKNDLNRRLSRIRKNSVRKSSLQNS